MVSPLGEIYTSMLSVIATQLSQVNIGCPSTSIDELAAYYCSIDCNRLVFLPIGSQLKGIEGY